jgi:hypothetical protein
MDILFVFVCCVFVASVVCTLALIAGCAGSSRELPADLAEEPLLWQQAQDAGGRVKTPAPHQA